MRGYITSNLESLYAKSDNEIIREVIDDLRFKDVEVEPSHYVECLFPGM